jgi:hypothetical protein
MFKSILTCTVLCAAMLAAGCNRDATAGGVEEAAGGLAEKVSENAYRNAAFGLTVTAPDSWSVMDNQQTKRLMDVGTDVATAGNDRLKAVAEASKQGTTNIFTFFKHPLGTPVEFNPSVMGVAENLMLAPGVKTGRDYFFHARKLMEQSSMPVEFVGDYTTAKIGGQAFDRMNVRMDVNGVSVNQSYYAARHDNFVVVIIQSYQTDAEREETMAVVDTIKLDW